MQPLKKPLQKPCRSRENPRTFSAPRRLGLGLALQGFVEGRELTGPSLRTEMRSAVHTADLVPPEKTAPAVSFIDS